VQGNKVGKSVSTKKGSAELFQPALPLDGKTFKKALADARYSQTALAKTLGLLCPHERRS